MKNLMLREDEKWLLKRIESLWKRYETNKSWIPNHKNIWQGSYDVWFCEQDKLDSITIPKFRMDEAAQAGLIYSQEILHYDKYKTTVWHLTELGKEKLK